MNDQDSKIQNVHFWFCSWHPGVPGFMPIKRNQNKTAETEKTCSSESRHFVPRCKWNVWMSLTGIRSTREMILNSDATDATKSTYLVFFEKKRKKRWNGYWEKGFAEECEWTLDSEDSGIWEFRIPEFWNSGILEFWRFREPVDSVSSWVQKSFNSLLLFSRARLQIHLIFFKSPLNPCPQPPLR